MDSPAMQAGLQSGDVITAFGSSRIRYVRDLISACYHADPNESVEVTVMRQGAWEYDELTLTVETLDRLIAGEE